MTAESTMTSVPRPTSSILAFWVLVGFAVLLVGDAVVRADWHLFAIALAPACLVVWAGWLVLFRPSVRFDRRQVIVVNPGRIIDVPWRLVNEVQQRFQIVLSLEDGSRITCWGSPFPEKPGLRRAAPGTNRRTVPGSELGGALDSARGAVYPDSPPPVVTRRWDAVPLAIGALIIVACLVELAVAR